MEARVIEVIEESTNRPMLGATAAGSAPTKVWLVLPAYNEAESLPLLLRSAEREFGEIGIDYRILVVNDGSTDETQAIIDVFAKNSKIIGILHEKNKGLAETIKRGLREACARASKRDVIVAMDADNTHPVGLIHRMVRRIKEGNDVVIASRYVSGSHIRGLSMRRRFLSWGASMLFRVLFPIKGVKDYTCGFRAYKADALSDLMKRYGDDFVSETGFSCMAGILLRLREQRLIFSEVPLILRYDFKQGDSKMKVLKTVGETLMMLAKKRLKPATPVKTWFN